MQTFHRPLAKYLIIFIAHLFLVMLMSLPVQVRAVTKEKTNDCIDLLIRPNPQDLKVKLDKTGLHVESFDKSTIAKLLQERSKIKTAYGIMNSTILGSENFIFGEMAAQIAAYHTYLYGGPGAGKTLIPHTLNPNIWYKLVSEQTTPMQLFGGQTLAGAEKGSEEINLEGALVKSEFVNIDEVDKAQPQLLADFLPILNTGERRISIQGKPVRVATRSVHFTSNLNLYDMINRFAANGMDGSGLAFLNRIQIKMRVPNWLESHLMDQMIANKKERDRLKALALISPKAQEALKKLEMPSDINWVFLEWASETMIRASSDHDLMLRELVEKYASDIRSKLKMSDVDLDGEKYSPTAEMTTRLVNEIPKFERATALLDLLLSDLSDEEVARLVSKPIELSPLSTWRSFWMLTSVGPGRTRLNIPKLEVDINMVRQANGTLAPMESQYLADIARDKNEVQEESNVSDERAKWSDNFTSLLKASAAANKAVSKILPEDGSDENFEKVDFESIIYKHRK